MTPDQNIEQVKQYLDYITADESAEISDYQKSKILALILKQVSETIEKTLIQVDPYIDYEFRIQFEELKQTPPTPNGDEQGASEKPQPQEEVGGKQAANQSEVA